MNCATSRSLARPHHRLASLGSSFGQHSARIVDTTRAAKKEPAVRLSVRPLVGHLIALPTPPPPPPLLFVSQEPFLGGGEKGKWENFHEAKGARSNEEPNWSIGSIVTICCCCCCRSRCWRQKAHSSFRRQESESGPQTESGLLSSTL